MLSSDHDKNFEGYEQTTPNSLYTEEEEEKKNKKKTTQ